jgi:hypothetical protein
MAVADDQDRAHRAKLLEDSINRVLDEREKKREEGELSVRGPFGILVSGKGRTVVAVLVIACVSAAVWWHDKRAEDQMAKSVAEHREMTERMAEMVYVLTLDERERKGLNLQVPDSLRRRQVYRP